MTRPPVACIVLLMSACGGGGGSDEPATSASPPAATPAPIAASPAPAPAPSRAPAPVSSGPPALRHPDIPGTDPPTFVGANVVGPSLAMLITGPVGPQPTQGQMVGGTTMAYIAQTSQRNPFGPSTYYFVSANPQTFREDPAQPSRFPPDATHLAKTELRTQDAPTDAAGTWLGSDMVVEGWPMTRAEGGFSASGNLPLNTALATWRTGVWFAELRINPDTDSALYRLCWRVRLLAINRLSCGKFNKLTAEFRGIYVSDASYGEAVIWETQQ